MTCNVLNNLLIQYSNVGCFPQNIISVQFLGGEGGACSLNGVEYKYVQERKIPKNSHSSIIKDSSCQGNDTERFIKFSQSQDDTFHLFMLHISLTIISTSNLSLYSICPQNKYLQCGLRLYQALGSNWIHMSFLVTMIPGMSGSSQGSGFPGAPLTVKFCIRADIIRNIV